MLPSWLQELRDLLALPDYPVRQAALREWERRWTLELHLRKLFTADEMSMGGGRIADHASEQVRHALGHALWEVMGTMTIGQGSSLTDFGRPMTEIRGDVLAIRATPQEKGESNAS